MVRLPLPSLLHSLAATSRWLPRLPPYAARASSSGLRSSRVALRKRFGQHLLKNPDVVANIVALAAVQPHETAFEIGPGTGVMTVHLLKAARMVYAVELDRDMHRIVVGRVAGAGLADKFQCVCGDFLAVPLPPFDVLCANIPYQISSPVLDRLLFHRPLPRAAVIMFQLEFAERMVARPGSSQYCRLSVNCALLCSSVRLAMKIGREQFRPPPKVDSGVVELVPREAPHAALRRPGELLEWDAFLRILFASKNKTLRSLFGSSKPLLVALTVLRKGAGGRGDGTACASAATGAAPAAADADARERKGTELLRTAMGSCTRAAAEATRRDVLHAISRAVPGSVVLEGDGVSGAAPRNQFEAPLPLLLHASHGTASGEDSLAGEDGGGDDAAAPPGGPLLSARPNALHVTDLLAVFFELRGAGFAFPVAPRRAAAEAALAAYPESATLRELVDVESNYGDAGTSAAGGHSLS